MQEDRGEKMVGIVLNDNAYEQDIRELLMASKPAVLRGGDLKRGPDRV